MASLGTLSNDDGDVEYRGKLQCHISEKIMMLVPRDNFAASSCCLQRHRKHFDVLKTLTLQEVECRCFYIVLAL